MVVRTTNVVLPLPGSRSCLRRTRSATSPCAAVHSTSDSSDSDASSEPDAPRNSSRQIIPLVTDVTDVAAVEGAVVQYTPSYIAEAIPKAVLCGMMSQRVDYPAYLALVTAAYRVISEDVRAAAETIPRKLLTNLIQAQK